MIDKLRKLLRPQGLEEVVTPKNKKAAFVVSYKNRLIGTLSLNNGEWTFIYSDEYKNDRFIAPLFDFPDVNKKYTSDSLWSFFETRIPGLKQPSVKETLEKEKIDKTDIVALLERFGKRTVMNPFVLEQQHFKLT
jgi:HipA-like protein